MPDRSFESVCIAIVFAFLLSVPPKSVHADTLGNFSLYAEWQDVSTQGAGTWTKNDSPQLGQGELITAPAHNFGFPAVPRSGELMLDLRTEASYNGGGDGADYSYFMHDCDYGGLDPASFDSGTLELDYYICPDTWSNDLGFFLPEGIYQEVSLANGDGDIMASIGMYSTGNSNNPEVHYSVDGENWINTGLTADARSWTNVNIALDLDAMTTEFSYTDINSNSHTSDILDWSSGITDTTVQELNFQQIQGAGKNYFDDFSFAAVSVAVPEPSVLALAMFGLGLASIRRRRGS